MRLRNLKIHRFGGVQGMEVKNLSPGLNVVLGPNEAGKTTLLEAVRSALFGFQSRDAGRNAFEAGDEGRSVELDLLTDEAERLHLERREAGGENHTTLTDAAGEELPSGELGNLTHNLDRTIFEKLFAFSLEELQGMESLTGGDVRDRVLGAAFGVVSPQGAITTLRERTIQQGEKVEQARDRLREARLARSRREDETREREVREQELAALKEDLARHDEMARQGKALERQLRHRLDLWDLAQELLDKRRGLDGLDALASLPPTPVALLEELESGMRESQRSIDRLDSQVRELEAELAVLAEREGVPRDPAPGAELARGAALYDQWLRDFRDGEREEAKVSRKLAILLEELGAGWEEENLHRHLPPREQVQELEASYEEIDHLQRALGMERQRLREVLAAKAPPDQWVRPVVTVLSLFFALFSSLGFFAGVTMGLISLGVAAVIILSLVIFASRLRSHKAPGSQEHSLLLLEVEEALRGNADPGGRSQLVRQLARKTAELEATIARVGFGAHLRPREVRDQLRRFEEITRLRERQTDLRRAQRELDETLCRHESLGAQVAEQWGLPVPARGELGRMLTALEARRGELHAARERWHELEGRLEGARETLSSHRERLDTLEARRSELFRLSGARDADELRQLARRQERWREAAAEVERLEIAFRARAGAEDPADLLHDLATRDPDEMEAELEDLEDREETSREETEALLKRRGVLEELVRNEGYDEALAAARQSAEEARRELVEVIESWTAGRLAIELASAAKERLEEQSQGPVLEKASQLFATITEGRYRRIISPLGSGQLELERADGYRVSDFKTLSRGTREELYLAVRLAFLAHFCREEGPMPVMMDDVLVNFDPGRARRAAQVIADLQADTQIIFFTCHPHVVESFRNLSDPMLVELPGPVMPAVRAVASARG